MMHHEPSSSFYLQTYAYPCTNHYLKVISSISPPTEVLFPPHFLLKLVSLFVLRILYLSMYLQPLLHISYRENLP